MFTGAEEWSTGFFLGEENEDAPDPTQQTADDILAAFTTFFTHADTRIASTYKLTQCKVAKLDDNGQTISGKVFYANPSGTVSGAVNGVVIPPQLALVVTLRSDRPRGKASKGRMYLPGITPNFDTGTGKIQASHITGIADNLKIFFDALVGDADIPGELILAAKSSGPLEIIPAQNDYVETIRVGDVMDTQRRRRNQLVETYTARTLL